MLRIIKTALGYGTLATILVSGVLMNIVQIFLYFLIRPFARDTYRSINSYLNYSVWSQAVAVADWVTNLKCRIYYKDEESFREHGTISGIVCANHRYDIDWLATWLISEKCYTLGNDKAMIKSSLRFLPVFGWGALLSDMIMLSRDWNKDKDKLAKVMDILVTYSKAPIVSFFEGTRFTKQKYEASVKFAEERNLPLRLKHHLVPRTRGFQLMMQRIQAAFEKDPKLNFGLYNVEIAVENDDNSKASLSRVLGGTPSCVHIYVERLDIRKIPADSESECAEYLYDVYKRKDELFEHFKENGEFPGVEKPYRKRVVTLVNWLAWMFVLYFTFFYYYLTTLWGCFTGSGNTIYMVVLSSLLLLIMLTIKIMINSTKVSKSSSYGTDKGK